MVVIALVCQLGVPSSNIARTCLYFSFLSVLVLSLLLILNATWLISVMRVVLSRLHKKAGYIFLCLFQIHAHPLATNNYFNSQYKPVAIYMFVSSRENTKIAILQMIRSTLTLSEVC